MKKLYFKHGFETIFSLSLMVILVLPAIVFAQNQKDMEITIQNGDTTINGQKLKDLSPDDRQEALNDINRLNGGGGHRLKTFRLQSPGDNHWELMADSESLRDGAGHQLHIRKRFNGDITDGPEERIVERHVRIMPPPAGRRFAREFERPNTQNFNYSNTGPDGMTTRINFHVSDAANDEEPDSKPAKPALEVTDFSLVPQFSTGKTLLMFSLPAKGFAEVSMTDSEGKQLWSEKTTSESFRTAFVFPFNGIYFLHIKQGGKTLTKRIVKD